MFFEISKTTNNLFGSTIPLPNGLVFNSDLGWQTFSIKDTHIIYKGYHTESFNQQTLFEQMIIDPTPRYHGNFCMLLSDGTHTTITHNIDRSFPLIRKDNCISNLYIEPGKNIWADCFLKVDGAFTVEKNYFDAFQKKYQQYSFDEALEKVHHILLNTFENFLKQNKKPIKIFLSGGIDTLTCYTYLDYFTKNYELVDYEYHKFTHFYKQNYHERIRKFWGYTQCHTWGDSPAVLVTGSCGDEYFLRGPITANLILMHHNVNVFELFKDKDNCYHYHYFNREKNKDIFTEQLNNNSTKLLVQNKQTVNDYVCDMLVNDHQHWHLDETVFFTPFKNMEIAKIILGLPKENFINQVLDAEFNKKLIELINPKNLSLLSKQKNYQTFKVD